MPSPNLVPLFARVPASLRKKVRIEAAKEDRSMNQVITSALKVYFSMPKDSATRKKK